MESKFTADAEAQNPQNDNSASTVKMDIKTPISKFSSDDIFQAFKDSATGCCDPFSLFVGLYDILKDILIYSESDSVVIWDDLSNLFYPMDFYLCLVQKALDIKS